MTSLIQGYEDMLVRGAARAHTTVHAMTDGVSRRIERTAESHAAWFAIVIPLVVLAGIGIFAYLTVQCWNRGYNGFTGRFTRTDGWTSATISFECA